MKETGVMMNVPKAALFNTRDKSYVNFHRSVELVNESSTLKKASASKAKGRISRIAEESETMRSEHEDLPELFDVFGQLFPSTRPILNAIRSNVIRTCKNLDTVDAFIDEYRSNHCLLP